MVLERLFVLFIEVLPQSIKNHYYNIASVVLIFSDVCHCMLVQH